MSASSPHPSIELCPGGPMLVRGDATIRTEDGTVHRTHRPVSAVCRCGKSALAPWCDGTHQLLAARDRPQS